MIDLQKAIKDRCGHKMALSTFVRDAKSKCLMDDDGYGELYLKSTGELLHTDPFDMLDIPRIELKNYIVMWYNK